MSRAQWVVVSLGVGRSPKVDRGHSIQLFNVGKSKGPPIPFVCGHSCESKRLRSRRRFASKHKHFRCFRGQLRVVFLCKHTLEESAQLTVFYDWRVKSPVSSWMHSPPPSLPSLKATTPEQYIWFSASHISWLCWCGCALSIRCDTLELPVFTWPVCVFQRCDHHCPARLGWQDITKMGEPIQMTDLQYGGLGCLDDRAQRVSGSRFVGRVTFSNCNLWASLCSGLCGFVVSSVWAPQDTNSMPDMVSHQDISDSKITWCTFAFQSDSSLWPVFLCQQGAERRLNPFLCPSSPIVFSCTTPHVHVSLDLINEHRDPDNDDDHCLVVEHTLGVIQQCCWAQWWFDWWWTRLQHLVLAPGCGKSFWFHLFRFVIVSVCWQIYAGDALLAHSLTHHGHRTTIPFQLAMEPNHPQA